jgi:hypothetical protein
VKPPRPTAGENGERRINIWVTTDTALALTRLAQRYGVTQREVLERLVAAAAEEIVSRLDPASPEWKAYFSLRHNARPEQSMEPGRGSAYTCFQLSHRFTHEKSSYLLTGSQRNIGLA